MERASNVPSIFNLTEGFLVSGTAGEGALFCLPTGECQLNLSAPARRNRGARVYFPRAGITNDRIYLYTVSRRFSKRPSPWPLRGPWHLDVGDGARVEACRLLN